MFDNHNNIILASEENFKIKLYSNSNTFAITAPKIGSRYMHQLFNRDEVELGVRSKINMMKDLLVSIPEKIDTNFNSMEYNKEIYNKKIYEEWNQLVEGELEKEVIILYRNPYERFVSAIIQDFSSAVSSNDYFRNTFLKELLIREGFLFSDIEYFLKFFVTFLQRKTAMGNENDSSVFSIEFKKCMEIFTYLLTVFLKEASIYGTHHYSDYIQPIYSLYNLNFFNKENTTFIDLDTTGQIESHFEGMLKNSPGVPNKFSNESFGKTIVKKIIKEESTIERQVKTLLKSDFSIYTLLNTINDNS